MKYLKPSLSYEQQADRLIERGLVAEKASLVDILSNISYYHFSAYLFPFKQDNSDCLKPGTSLDQIYRRYRFDRRLRCLIMDALERVETALKAKVVTVFTQKYGPFGYLDKYDEPNLPFWMVAELLTFGNILTIYRKMHRPIQQEIASEFGVPVVIMESWLLTLNHVRNICAHHARLWNRRLGIRPQIPTVKKHPEWAKISNDKPFVVLMILSQMLKKCAPKTEWRTRIETLMAEYSDLPFECIGFLADWKTHNLWKC